MDEPLVLVEVKLL